MGKRKEKTIREKWKPKKYNNRLKNGSLSKKSYISRVSALTGVKEDIVRDVINAEVFVIIDELLTNEIFHWEDFLTIKTTEINFRKSHDIRTGQKQIMPPTKRFSVSMSDKATYLLREKYRNINNYKFGTNRGNWREAFNNITDEQLEQLKEKNKTKAT